MHETETDSNVIQFPKLSALDRSGNPMDRADLLSALLAGADEEQSPEDLRELWELVAQQQQDLLGVTESVEQLRPPRAIRRRQEKLQVAYEGYFDSATNGVWIL